jgi:YfiH family protein
LNLGASRGDAAENVAENFRLFRCAIGAAEGPLVKNHQVQGTLVRSVTAADAEPPEVIPTFDADGLVTDEEGVTLTVFSADCLPILFYDPVRRCVAAVHAGWRGTAADIAGKTVRAMRREFGCDPKNIRAAIGPNISACCFACDADVPEAMVRALGNAALKHIRQQDDKYYVNLKEINAQFLRNAGVHHIEISTACTMCESHRFWSHRVTKGDRGSQGAFILCKGGSL